MWKILHVLHQKCTWQRDKIQSLYLRAEQDLEKQNLQIRAEGNKELKITDEAIVAKAIKLAQSNKQENIGFSYASVTVKTLVGICPVRHCGFEPKNNFRIDFFVTQDKKIGWECITRFDANQKDFVPKWKQDGLNLLWSVWKGDILELDIDANFKQKNTLPLPAGKHLFKVQKFSNGALQVNILNDARSLKEVDGQKRWVSGEKGLAFFTQAQARKVELTPFGKVYHKHKKLWHGKKTTPTQ